MPTWWSWQAHLEGDGLNLHDPFVTWEFASSRLHLVETGTESYIYIYICVCVSVCNS